MNVDTQICSGTMNLDRFLKEIKLIGGSYTFSMSPEKLTILSVKVNSISEFIRNSPKSTASSD